MAPITLNDTDSIPLRQYNIYSEILQNERAIWLQRPVASVGDAGLAVFLDGEYYLTHFGAPQTMVVLQKDESLPPMWSVYVSAREQAIRWPESFCNEDFAAFICRELVPSVEAKTGASGERLLIGVSLSGLNAAHIVLSEPDVFGRVLCHSGSFWWERGKLSTQVARWPRRQSVFRITVGDEETDTDVDHGNGLIQVDSQLASNQQMRDALLEHGYRVSYSEFHGGHDAPSWRRELPGDLRALYEMDGAH